MKKEIDNTRVIMNVVLSVLVVGLVGFSLFIWKWYMKKIVHLLSVSRCVLTIIPIGVINSTHELENWIESKY